MKMSIRGGLCFFLPEPTGKLPSRWKNHLACTGDVCQPGLSPAPPYLADNEKDGEGALSECSLRAMTQAAAMEGGNLRDQRGG